MSAPSLTVAHEQRRAHDGGGARLRVVDLGFGNGEFILHCRRVHGLRWDDLLGVAAEDARSEAVRAACRSERHAATAFTVTNIEALQLPHHGAPSQPRPPPHTPEAGQGGEAARGDTGGGRPAPRAPHPLLLPGQADLVVS